MTGAFTAESTNKALATVRAILDRSEEEDTTSAMRERRLALIHRLIMPDVKCPREYAILVTDRRSIFIRLERTRSSFVLRGEMRYGTEMNYRRTPNHETAMKFYLVPLGAYFKPRRQTKSREKILREYALDALKAFREAVPVDVMSS
jgi:hypothetical protein